MTSAMFSAAGAVQLSDVGAFSGADSAEATQLRQRLPRFLGASYEIAGIARPSNARQVASAVRSGGEQGLAILALYSASNIGARLTGDGPTLVIDLSGMNRVVTVDAENATALVEPGVTYAQLGRHLDQAGLPLLVDSERDPDASVAASIFSKGIGRTPYGDHLLLQCGAELALPGGRLVRTGMGAMENSRTWQLYKYSLGPYPDGLAVQSNHIIPTQVGLWLMGRPPSFRHFAYDLADDAALDQALEAIRPLKIGNMLAGTIVASHRDFDARRGGRSRDAAWRLQGALYGAPGVVEFSMRAVHGALGGLGTTISAEATATDVVLQEEAALMAGRPGSRPLTLSGVRNPAYVTFVAPIEGAHALEMKRIAAGVTGNGGQPPLLELLVVGRSLLANCYLPDPREATVRDLVTAMGEAGYGTVAESPECNRIVERTLGVDPQKALVERLGERLAAG